MVSGDALIFCATSQPVYSGQPGDALVFGGPDGGNLIFSGTSATYTPPAGDSIIFGCAPPPVGDVLEISASGLLGIYADVSVSGLKTIHADGTLGVAADAHATLIDYISAQGLLDLYAQAHIGEITGLQASGLLALNADAHLSAIAHINADGDIALDADAAAVLAWNITADGVVALNGSSYYAPTWYTRAPLVGGTSGGAFGGVGMGWSPQQRLESRITAPHTQAAPKQPQPTCPWDELERIDPQTASNWNQIPKLERAKALPWGDLIHHPAAEPAISYSHPAPNNREAVELPWGDLEAFSADNALAYRHPPRNYSATALPWDQLSSIDCQLDVAYSHPAAKDKLVPIISGPYWYPRWCVWQYNAPRGDQLIFRALSVPIYAAPAGNVLIFTDTTEQGREHICYDGTWNGPKDAYWYQPHPWEIPEPNIRSFYIVMNTVSLRRVADNIPIPIESMSIGTDMDSWCWSLSAQLRRKTDLDLVRPTGGAPVEVEASINGNSWRFVIESYGNDRSYGQWGYSIQGRSLSAYLAQPYSAPGSLLQPGQRSAAQLADEALTDSGFTADWQLTDWLVPGGVYSVTNQTPMQQLLTIAAAAGGVVHSDPSANIISLLPWYKHLPWEWGAVAVDAILPTFKERRTSYQPQPLYTGVYTSGQAQGVMCFVRRTGTDGSAQPQMVTDPLITATEAGLQRGKRILADSGARSVESLTAPLFDDPGLLTPGMLIEVIDSGSSWRGLVTRCSIAAQRPTVTQSLDVLRYHGT